jgi:hypothetical protein
MMSCPTEVRPYLRRILFSPNDWRPTANRLGNIEKTLNNLEKTNIKILIRRCSGLLTQVIHNVRLHIAPCWCGARRHHRHL